MITIYTCFTLTHQHLARRTNAHIRILFISFITQKAPESETKYTNSTK